MSHQCHYSVVSWSFSQLHNNVQGGRFVLSRSNPLEIGLKLHYQVKKQLFSAQNGGRK